MLLMSSRGRGISGLVLALATVGGSLAGIADLAAAQTVRIGSLETLPAKERARGKF